MSVALDSLKRLGIRRDSSAPRASGHVTQLSLTDNVDNLSPGTRWSRHLSLRINARSSRIGSQAQMSTPSCVYGVWRSGDEGQLQVYVTCT